MANQPSNRLEEQQQRFEKQLERLEEMIVQSNIRDMAYHLSSKREVIKINLLAGLARGIGLTIGTAIFLALFFYLLSNIVTLPVIGQYIADLMEYIEAYRQF